MNRLKLTRRTRLFHKWVGLIVAVQLVLWIAGGLVMSSLNLDIVRGAHNAANTAPEAIALTTDVLPPSELLDRINSPVTAMTMRMWQGQAVYVAESANGISLYSARTGKALSPIDETSALKIARADYTGNGKPVATQWLEVTPREARGRDAPLWRVRFDDGANTAIYVSAQTGAVVARRNDWWRLFDVVWMLHIMDYDTRDDFNHPLLIVSAATALLFALSGVVLLTLSLLPRKQRPGSRSTNSSA